MTELQAATPGGGSVSRNSVEEQRVRNAKPAKSVAFSEMQEPGK